MLNIKKNRAWQQRKFQRNPLCGNSLILAKIFGCGFILVFAGFLITLFGELLNEKITDNIFGGSLVLLSLFFIFWQIYLFGYNQLKNQRSKYSLVNFLQKPADFNTAGFLNWQALEIVWKTLLVAKKQKFAEPTSKVLLYNLLTDDLPEINFIFGRVLLSQQALQKSLKNYFQEIPVIGLEKLIEKAGQFAQKQKENLIYPCHLLLALASMEGFFKEFLRDNDLSEKDIENLVLWQAREQKQKQKAKKFWLWENLVSNSSMARDFASGFSITLDKYSIDLRKQIKQKGLRKIIGHKEAMERVERALIKQGQNNVLLVGEPGSGRKAVVEALCQKAFQGETPEKLDYKRFLMFNPSLLASRVTSKEATEELVDRCFAEATRAGNIVLVIDEFHQFLTEYSKPGAINISAIMARYLPLSNFQIIAITSFEGYRQILETNSALLSQFEKVEAPELSAGETLEFLETWVPFLEKTRQKFISYQALREIIALSAHYLKNAVFPEKALRVLDESIALIVNAKDKILLPSHIKTLLSQKTKIPLEDLAEKEKKILLNLEEVIHQRVIGQDEAVKQVAWALRRARANIQVDRQGPIGSFLFLGPTGVGKTETAKALASAYFGSEKKMIRLDMSEFQNSKDIARLIGSLDLQGILTTAVRENPFSLVLLDEVEKAHPNILNLFLQVLDEAWLTDGLGRKVDFSDTLIIVTSNAGAELIRQDIAQDKKLDLVRDNLLDFLLKQGIFRPELINRFDGIIVFKPLTKAQLLQIAYLMLSKISESLEQKGIIFDFSQEFCQRIAELSFSPVFGAREMKRVIQEKVENLLAGALLNGKIRRGCRVEIDSETFELKIEKR